MMKNNQLFQRLGLGQLKTLMTTTTTNNKDHCPQKSGSLYDGEDNDGSDEEEVTTVLNYYFLCFLTLYVITSGFAINLICICYCIVHIQESRCRKGVHTHNSNDGEQMSTKVTRANKRIVAP
jgi:hypothetical protein